MKIAALMLSGLSSYDRAKAACETWLTDFEWFQIHSFAPAHDLPITRVGTREGPRSCFEKRLMGLEQVRESEPHSFDWYLCCSDDNWIWRENLERCFWIHSWDKADNTKWKTSMPLLVGGHSNTLRIADGTVVTYPSGGAGYCLNRPALDLMVGNLGRLRKVWAVKSNNDDIEDAFMGWAAAELGIPYLETPGFYGCNPGLPGIERRACERGCVAIERPISFHYITADQMRALRATHLASRNIHSSVKP